MQEENNYINDSFDRSKNNAKVNTNTALIHNWQQIIEQIKQAQQQKSALNGFLFRLGLDKRVGLMSELPDNICPDRLERLPHLTELLAEPLKKRTLWHLLNSR